MGIASAPSSSPTLRGSGSAQPGGTSPSRPPGVASETKPPPRECHLHNTVTA